ncbi:MAG: phospho-sugar mutase [Oscillospiraceae bacterium]|jgi:phosphoglucomutase|nr:phospho-sugar mutase [Oscillospiraceae bacterium]
MNFEEKYSFWLKNVPNGSDIYKELIEIKEKKDEIYKRFNKDVNFGTAGVRAIMGAGSACLNIFTVSWITKAVSNFIKTKKNNLSVVIAYDTRRNSKLFAQVSCSIFISNNIKVYCFSKPKPTPLLSFAVRNLCCSAGVMITASHNPAEYNGYKLYGPDGGQISDVTEICEELNKINIFENVKFLDFNENKIKNADFVEDIYIEKILNIRFNKKKLENLNVVYSPLNGSARDIFLKVSKKIGIKTFNTVKEQEFADENFTTCKNPNPEKKESFNLAIELAKKKNADLIILNDPDGDRIGVAVKSKNNYKIINGNELSDLFLNYIIEQNLDKFSKKNNFLIFKSLVSGGLINRIANYYGIQIKSAMPGFKNIAKLMKELEDKNQINNFLMGFEESHGFLFCDFVRDKDGIVAAMLICEIVSYYKNKDNNLIQILDKLYNKFGFYVRKTLYFKINDENQEITKKIKSNLLKKDKNFEFFFIEQNLNYEISLDKNIILSRFSGTEPVIKFYIFANANTKFEAMQNYQYMENFIINLFPILEETLSKPKTT